MSLGLKDVTACLGYQRITSLSAATNLTLPQTQPGGIGTLMKPTLAVIIAETQAVRWRDDGTAPTSSVGMPLAVDTPFVYDGDLTNIKFIEQTASAVLHISYYC